MFWRKKKIAPVVKEDLTLPPRNQGCPEDAVCAWEFNGNLYASKLDRDNAIIKRDIQKLQEKFNDIVDTITRTPASITVYAQPSWEYEQGVIDAYNRVVTKLPTVLEELYEYSTRIKELKQQL